MTTGKQVSFQRQAWLMFVFRYLTFLAFANALWEFAHMPLYKVWREGSWSEIVFNGVHCTIGDLMIAIMSLLSGVIIAGRSRWPENQRLNVAIATLLIGLSYTAFSEWLNVYVTEAWSYSELMPLLPGTGLGLSPLGQWAILPAVGFFVAYRGASLTTRTASRNEF